MKMIFYLVTDIFDGDKIDIPDDALFVTIHPPAPNSGLTRIAYLLEVGNQ